MLHRRNARTLILWCLLLISNRLTGQTLTLPLDGSGYQNAGGVRLQWEGAYQGFDVLVGTDSSVLVLQGSGVNARDFFLGPLDSGQTYYWRVLGLRGDGTRDTSAVWSFSTGDPDVVCKRLVPSADPVGYDTELDSRMEEFTKRISLRNAALVIIDFWPGDYPTADNTAELISLARRHNIPVIYANAGIPLNERVLAVPWETIQDDPLDNFLDGQGITTLLFAGYGSGSCVTISRPNSINTITLRNPGRYDIVFFEDCTFGDPWLHHWNIHSIMMRWQTTTLPAFARALGDTATSIPWPYVLYDLQIPLRMEFGESLHSHDTALLLVNMWATHENDGWLERIRVRMEESALPVLRFARARGLKVIHVAHEREIDPRFAPLPDEPVVRSKDSLWRFVRNSGVRNLLVAGNFNNDMNSIFPLIDGWGLGNEGHPGVTALIQDAITAFEAPGTLSDEALKRAFLFVQILTPGTGTMGEKHFVSTVPILRRNTNILPEFLPTSVPVATEDSTYSYQVAAVDADTVAWSDYVRYRLAVKPAWLEIDSVSGIMTGIPRIGDLADTVVSVQAYDTQGGVAELWFAIPIIHVNHAPVFVSPADTVATEDSLYAYQPVVHDIDLGLFADTLRFSLAGGPSWLSIDSVSGALSGVPGPLDVGESPVSIHVSDGQGGEAVQSFVLNVLHTNHSPYFVTLPDSVTLEDSLYAYQAMAVDPDSALWGDYLRYRFAVKPAWLEVDSVSGLLSGIPRIGDLTDTVVILQALDPFGALTEQQFSIRIIHVNHAPMFASLADTVAWEDSLYHYRPAVDDIDLGLFADTLSFVLVNGPSWLSVDPVTGVLSGVPGPHDVGMGQVSLEVSDGQGGIARQNFVLTVLHTNHSPRFVTFPDSVITEYDLYLFRAYAVDPDSALFGDRVTYALPVGPSWLEIEPETGVLSGTPPNASPDTTFTLIASDGQLADSLVVRLKVIAVNDPPVLGFLPPVVFDEDSSVSVSFLEWFPFVQDPDNADSLLIWTVLPGEHLGILRMESGVRVSSIPDWSGCDSVQVIVQDPLGLSDTSWLHVRVRPVNDAPTWLEIPPIVFPEDSSYTVELALFARDIDDSISALRWSLAVEMRSTLPSVPRGLDRQKHRDSSQGNVWGNSALRWYSEFRDGFSDSLIIVLDSVSGTMTVTASQNFWGSDIPVSVTVTDPGALSDVQTLLLTVLSVNDPPKLRFLPQVTFDEDSSHHLPVALLREYLTDPDDPDTLHSWKVLGTQRISVRELSDHFLLNPLQDWHGRDTLRIIVRDPSGAADTSRLIVRVLPLNDPPRIVSVPDTLFTKGIRTIYALTVVDVDDSVFTYRCEGPEWIWIDDRGIVHGSPQKPGKYPITVYVADPHGAEDSQSFVLDVSSVNSAELSHEGVPASFFLYQNFPNPFNPSTTIRFDLPRESHVVLALCDLTGRHVATILEGLLPAGFHAVSLSGAGLASGSYFYRITAEHYTNTRKLVYLK